MMAAQETPHQAGASLVRPPEAPDASQHAPLIERWIETHPTKPALGELRLRHYAVPVWALIGHARATGRTLHEVARAYALPLEAVEAAFAYYEAHAHEIDDRIAANDAD